MRSIFIKRAGFFLAVILLSFASSAAEEKIPPIPNCLVKLYVTYQEFEPLSPWKKKKAQNRSGYGCVLPSGKILTTADIIKDSTLIKVEKNTDKKYYSARVERRDYDVCLAIVSVEDKSFFSDLAPLELEEKIRIDQPVKFLLFEDSKQIRAVPGNIVNISVEEYFLGWNNYLLYGAAVNFEDRKGGWSEPVISDGKLVGLTMSYSREKQYAKIIPASIISHFLGAIKDGDYIGFSYPGFWATVLRCPDFKEYLGLKPEEEGLYVRAVFPRSSADGVLERGDVLLSVDGHKLDSNGYYQHPEWGKLDRIDIFTRSFYPGDEVDLEFLRDGKVVKRKMSLKRFDQSDYLIPPYNFDSRPNYIVVGGLVIQELGVDYLKAWGKGWSDKGNKKFLYYYRYKTREPEPLRKRLVILNKVVPDDINVGYQEMRDLVVSTVNGNPISEIGDVVEALKAPEEGFHRFRFEEYNQEIILPVEGLAEADRRIAEEYGLDRLTNVE